MESKGLIIMGAPASGKSIFFKNSLSNLGEFHHLNFQYWNQDLWVENLKSEYYNNPLKASKHLYGTVLPDIMSRGNNFILDTTGSNINTLRKTIDNKQYQFKAILVYCNPIIAFKRNFSRERRLPKQVLMDLWLRVYSQIDEYINMFGEDNIYVYETEYTEEEEFIIYRYKHGRSSILSELKDLDVESSFRKDTTNYTVEQILEKQTKFINILEEIDDNFLKIEYGLHQHNSPKQIILQLIQEWTK